MAKEVDDRTIEWITEERINGCGDCLRHDDGYKSLMRASTHTENERVGNEWRQTYRRWRSEIFCLLANLTTGNNLTFNRISCNHRIPIFYKIHIKNDNNFVIMWCFLETDFAFVCCGKESVCCKLDEIGSKCRQGAFQCDLPWPFTSLSLSLWAEDDTLHHSTLSLDSSFARVNSTHCKREHTLCLVG